MKQRKILLNLIGWDSTSNHALEREDIPENMIPPRNYDDSNLDCPASLSGVVNIKIFSSIIIQLKYDSIVAQYSNWLADLKTTFNKNPVKFLMSCQKIILASVILDKQLKTIYNNTVTATLILSRHWRKFECWLCDIVLHQGSDKLKLSSEFIVAC